MLNVAADAPLSISAHRFGVASGETSVHDRPTAPKRTTFAGPLGIGVWTGGSHQQVRCRYPKREHATNVIETVQYAQLQ